MLFRCRHGLGGVPGGLLAGVCGTGFPGNGISRTLATFRLPRAWLIIPCGSSCMAAALLPQFLAAAGAFLASPVPKFLVHQSLQRRYLGRRIQVKGPPQALGE